MSDEDNEKQLKLYAGKFKTVEELENGYKNSLPTYQENEKLKKQLEEATKVPDDYLLPNGLTIDDSRLADLKARAKEAGLTQAQYEKLLASDKNRVESYQKRFEDARKQLGEEKLNVLRDYVEKNYPEPLRENLLNTFIGNEEARQAALKHREQLLNSQVPGMSKTSAGSYQVTDEDVHKAYLEKEKNKGDMKARIKYLNLLAARAEQQAS